MNLIKRMIPNNIKQEGKYFLMDLLKIPYNRFGVPVEIQEWLPNNRPITFIDIGASYGQFSTALSQYYNIERAIIVEPLTNHIPMLRSRFADQAKYSIFNLAVAESSGEADFYTFGDYDYNSSFLKVKRELMRLPGFEEAEEVTLKVKTEPLDRITADCKIGSIDLLKIDVQGAEHMVLRSGYETLKRTRLVYIEFSYRPIYEGSSTFFDLYKILTDQNFRMVSVMPGYKTEEEGILQGDALFVNNLI
ncbi:FkbM family methyltransferase [Mucilaginibacter corticis]|uniref:FkbM family methyltransferase n=1 Tax=Mucilaginibacter corticis TaxID=2597670 RepID=A0A556M7V2_9SPHI|nr:FkbM family methyltransferase [Mucilaginibacter corticis]TSJ35969.1 FkbM family methyltransferase [Mucilaginibacter corticis]